MAFRINAATNFISAVAAASLWYDSYTIYAIQSHPYLTVMCVNNLVWHGSAENLQTYLLQKKKLLNSNERFIYSRGNTEFPNEIVNISSYAYPTSKWYRDYKLCMNWTEQWWIGSIEVLGDYLPMEFINPRRMRVPGTKIGGKKKKIDEKQKKGWNFSVAKSEVLKFIYKI